MWHGILLFLLGLLTGLIQNELRNPRMGLAAHLEGLMNGTFLLALGAAWKEVRLSERAARAAFGAALFGAYANWAVSLIAAALGTSSLTPIAGAGFNAQVWQERLVAGGFIAVGIAMITASAILLWGFRKREVGA
jgi:hydroxylaminobenzene mutase